MKPLCVLIVEDSEADAALLRRQLEKNGYTLTFKVVDTADSLNAALEKGTWDIVISDYVMPRFSALEVLKLLRERASGVPCIITSGRIGEDTAVECMREGARDYIMKDNLKRLGPAIERELKEAEMSRERFKAEESLNQSREQLRALKEVDTGSRMISSGWCRMSCSLP